VLNRAQVQAWQSANRILAAERQIDLRSEEARAGGIPIVQFGEAPHVANVTISGSNSTHDPYSFNSATYNGQPIIGSGNQLRTVPVGGADTISITFTEDVNIVASDLQVVGLRTANRPVLAEFSYDLGTMTATWRFVDWMPFDHFAASLSDAVTDVEGNPLDGEWTNPASLFTTNSLVSTFPSGDGVAGGDFTFVMTLLAGDADLDAFVGNADLSAVLTFWGLSPEALYSQGDFSGDGSVSQADF